MSEGNNIAIQNISYVREVDNNNLLSGELEKTFNLPHLNPLLSRRGIIWIFCCLFTFSSHATCTPTPDCASIGYTETSCETDYLACPFDSTKLKCIPCDSSFRYDCTGDNFTSGTGSTCNGKYASCTCSDSESIFKNGECVEPKCRVGYIYYSDASCSAELDNAKTAIGVVIKNDSLIMSRITSMIQWGGYGTDISDLTNYSNAKSDRDGKSNTNTIVTYFGKNVDTSLHAGVFCYNYSPTGAENTKGQWYLPSAGELNYNVINKYSELALVWVNKLAWDSDCLWTFWSSSEYDSNKSWEVDMGGAIGVANKNETRYVTCFLAIN